jgi:hypothetical protein
MTSLKSQKDQDSSQSGSVPTSSKCNANKITAMRAKLIEQMDNGDQKKYLRQEFKKLESRQAYKNSTLDERLNMITEEAERVYNQFKDPSFKPETWKVLQKSNKRQKVEVHSGPANCTQGGKLTVVSTTLDSNLTFQTLSKDFQLELVQGVAKQGGALAMSFVGEDFEIEVQGPPEKKVKEKSFSPDSTSKIDREAMRSEIETYLLTYGLPNLEDNLKSQKVKIFKDFAVTTEHLIWKNSKNFDTCKVKQRALHMALKDDAKCLTVSDKKGKFGVSWKKDVSTLLKLSQLPEDMFSLTYDNSKAMIDHALQHQK